MCRLFSTIQWLSHLQSVLEARGTSSSEIVIIHVHLNKGQLTVTADHGSDFEQFSLTRHLVPCSLIDCEIVNAQH